VGNVVTGRVKVTADIGIRKLDRVVEKETRVMIMINII
jgi:hypothetical protein